MALAAGFSLLAVGGAAARAFDRGWTPPAPVMALDETAAGIATALAWTPRSCESVVLWEPDFFARRTFRTPGPCPQTSTGRGISAVATDSRRVVWLAYVGGNTREHTRGPAPPPRRAPQRLRFAAADVDAPPPLVLGVGAASVGVLVETGHLLVVPLKRGGRVTDLDYARGFVRAFRVAAVGAV